MQTRPELVKKWSPILEAEGAGTIKDSYRKQVTAQLLENQERSMAQQAEALFETSSIANQAGGSISGLQNNNNSGGPVAGYDPILISLVRRAAPMMIAYDICGVQPMTQPTGLIFAMKSRYKDNAVLTSATEALFNEADTDFSGTGAHPAGTGMSTGAAEDLGENGTFGQMAFTIERTSVVAKSRALRAEYTVELAQDLKAVHGLDAEGELSNILSTEITAEINREVVRTMYTAAKAGADTGTAVAGTFNLDVDANGRWSVEKFKGLMFQIEREANMIAKETRRGRGNFIVTSSDVASALAMAGVLDYTPALSTGLNVDEASTTFAGVLNGKYRVYIDPYFSTTAADQFFLVGYKGSNAMDAGMFYCPYVPLEKVRAVDPATFQPKVGFKTRYGMVANPFTSLSAGTNVYYRKVTVTNLM